MWQEKAQVVAYSVILKLQTSRRFVSSSTRQRVIATLGRTEAACTSCLYRGLTGTWGYQDDDMSFAHLTKWGAHSYRPFWAFCVLPTELLKVQVHWKSTRSTNRLAEGFVRILHHQVENNLAFDKFINNALQLTFVLRRCINIFIIHTQTWDCTQSSVARVWICAQANQDLQALKIKIVET